MRGDSKRVPRLTEVTHTSVLTVRREGLAKLRCAGCGLASLTVDSKGRQGKLR